MLESQRRQYWLLFGDSAFRMYYSFFDIRRNIPLAYMSLQGIEVMNVDPHSVGVDVQKLFLEGKRLRTLSAELTYVLFLDLIWRLRTA